MSFFDKKIILILLNYSYQKYKIILRTNGKIYRIRNCTRCDPNGAQ